MNNRIYHNNIAIMIAILPYDIISYIVSYLYNINHYTALMLINKEIYNYLHNYTYKRVILSKKLIELENKYGYIQEKNDDDLYYPSSFNNSWNIQKCIVSNCQNKDNAIGLVYICCFNSTEIQFWNNGINLNSTNTHLKYIPYCTECMNQYINSQYLNIDFI